MPYVGQNIYNSSLSNSRNMSVEKINQIRSGQWGRIAPEQAASGRYISTKRSTVESINSGKFRGTIRDKQSEANQKSISGYIQRKQAIDQQG